MQPFHFDILTIIGPTASGKTGIATQLTQLVGGVLFGADSRQVYRGMDIGTGKDLSDFFIDGKEVPYEMIDICEAGERYNLHRYLTDFWHAYHALPTEMPKVLCGGTGLYLEAVLRGYDMPDVPENHALRQKLYTYTLAELQAMLDSYSEAPTVVDRQNSRRLIRAIEVAEYFQQHGEQYEERTALSGPIFCINIDRQERRNRISERLRYRLDHGMIEEIEGLLEHLQPEQLIYYGLEYKYVTEYVMGKLSRAEMEERLEIAIHQFAKRQMTWWRGMERRGFEIIGVEPEPEYRKSAEKILELTRKWEAQHL